MSIMIAIREGTLSPGRSDPWKIALRRFYSEVDACSLSNAKCRIYSIKTLKQHVILLRIEWETRWLFFIFPILTFEPS